MYTLTTAVHVVCYNVIYYLGAVSIESSSSYIESDFGYIVWYILSTNIAESRIPIHINLHGLLATNDTSQHARYQIQATPIRMKWVWLGCMTVYM